MKENCGFVPSSLSSFTLHPSPFTLHTSHFLDTAAYEAKIDPQDTILSLAERLAKFGGGGRDCSLPLAVGNGKYAKRPFAGVVLVSDAESWVYAGRAFGYGRQEPLRA